MNRNLLKLAGLSMALTGCQTAATIDAQQMLINFSMSYNALWQLATAFSYVLGFGLAFKAIYYLRVYGEARTMMTSQGNLKTPFMYLLISSFLIFLPTIYHVLLMTAFGTTSTSPIDYSNVPAGMSPMFIKAFYGAIQLIGLFTFIRGWIMMIRVADQNNQPGTFGKAIMHVLGGLLAINVIGTKDVIFSSFGIS